MLTISETAIEFIIKEEDSDQAYYNKSCTGFEYPGGSSGPTVGIGYDCGQCTRDEIQRDWEGLIPQPAINVLLAACGHQGESAHVWVQGHRHNVNIPWETAVTQFVQREVPKWIGRVAAVLPNCDLLPPDSLGALVSLAYNRGPSFNSGRDRDREMRAIKLHMVNKEFAKIPAEFRSMKRLWAGTALGHDLVPRREHEAQLFEAGLAAQPALVSQG